jgi:hypothetical protein
MESGSCFLQSASRYNRNLSSLYITIQSSMVPRSWDWAVFKYRTVKTHPFRSVFRIGNQASLSGLKRFGALLRSSPACASFRYSASTCNSSSMLGLPFSFRASSCFIQPGDHCPGWLSMPARPSCTARMRFGPKLFKHFFGCNCSLQAVY